MKALKKFRQLVSAIFLSKEFSQHILEIRVELCVKGVESYFINFRCECEETNFVHTKYVVVISHINCKRSKHVFINTIYATLAVSLTDSRFVDR